MNKLALVVFVIAIIAGANKGMATSYDVNYGDNGGSYTQLPQCGPGYWNTYGVIFQNIRWDCIYPSNHWTPE